MARKPVKIQPAELALSYTLPSGGSASTKYIDLAQSLSFVNRRLYEQAKCYYISRISAVNSRGVAVAVATLPDTWVTSNAHTKAHALWNQMNAKVLDDNPSVKPKWFDFKCFFDELHFNGGTGDAGPTSNLLPVDFSGATVLPGEWRMSQFVQPQHSVNTGTGQPLAADAYYGHILGSDVAGAGAPDLIASAAIVKGYANTRARVQPGPSVFTSMSTNWMTLLTDDGSQEPELADIIEVENDNPPYDDDEYVGGSTNFNDGVVQTTLVTTSSLGVDKDLGFKVPLGLLKVLVASSDQTTTLTIHLTPGTYKGVHATGVKQ